MLLKLIPDKSFVLDRIIARAFGNGVVMVHELKFHIP